MGAGSIRVCGVIPWALTVMHSNGQAALRQLLKGIQVGGAGRQWSLIIAARLVGSIDAAQAAIGLPWMLAATAYTLCKSSGCCRNVPNPC